MTIFLTGIAGFIGFHTAIKLLVRGDKVIGLDSINDYYDTRVKFGRLSLLGFSKQDLENDPYPGSGKQFLSATYPNLIFVRSDLTDSRVINYLFEFFNIEVVCHFAAQAGVRYSLTHPEAYITSNIQGFLTILEAARKYSIKHLVYASSSSVYGLNQQMPFSTAHSVDHPISLYAVSKKSNELMAHTYSHLYGIPTTGLRFFTVYGPWGRPDMALFLFTKSILEDKPINVFNNGNMFRDFTYIDDIVEGVIRVIDHPPKGNPNWNPLKPDPSSSNAPYRIYNIGNSKPVQLLDFINSIEEALGKKAKKNYLPLQPGDVPATWADTTDLERDLGYKPSTPINVGIRRFIDWYTEFYFIK